MLLMLMPMANVCFGIGNARVKYTYAALNRCVGAFKLHCVSIRFAVPCGVNSFDLVDGFDALL
jgi:hypothetical protein